jgi:signal transduction histidine kinase
MFRSLSEFLRRQPAWAVMLVACALLVLIGYIDARTGPELTFAHLYLVPVCLVAWLLGQRWGYAMALASAVVCLLAERMGAAVYTNPLVQEYNFLLRLAFFAASVWLIAMWRSIGKRLSSMVDQRTAALREEIAEREKAQGELRTLAAQLSAAEDAERRKLAYDIHDGMSQMLSLTKINLDAAVLEAPSESRLHARLVECAKSTDDLIRQTRSLTFDLHPAMLDDLGLVPTLQHYASALKQHGDVEVIVIENGLRRPLGSPLLNYLFRAIRELLSNAMKHGKASEIVVAVHWEPRGLRIVVDDDGGGFDAHSALLPESRRGLGLPGIEQRLESLGGKLLVESVAEQGTRIILEVPLAHEPLKENVYADQSVAG